MRHICQNVSVFFYIFSEHFFHIFETVNEYGTTFLLSWCLLSETVTIEMLSFSNNIISVTRVSLFVFQRALATSSWHKQVIFFCKIHLNHCSKLSAYDNWLSVVLGLNKLQKSLKEVLSTQKESLKDNWEFLLHLLLWINLNCKALTSNCYLLKFLERIKERNIDTSLHPVPCNLRWSQLKKNLNKKVFNTCCYVITKCQLVIT